MGTIGDGLIRRLRGRLGQRWTAQEEAPPEVPGTEQVLRAVDGAERGLADAADELASLLLAVSCRGDADLNARTERALRSAKPRMWLVLDVSARRSHWCTPRWADTVARRLLTGPGPLDLLLAACHPDGFVREAAVAAISERGEVVALPVLALRAADWVPAVRDRTRQICWQHLDRAPAEAITFLAPVAFALRARRTGDWLADAIEDLLRDGRALATALTAEDWRTRRNAHRIGVAAGRLGVDQLVRAARTDSDLPIRIMCAEAAIRTARPDQDVPRRLLTSRTAAVRAEAVRVLGAAGEVAPAVEALLDRSALVRATAQAIVRRTGADPAERYRTLIAAQPPSPSAIAGLGETGSSADVAVLRPWLTHPSSRGRAEAVRALRRLGCAPPELLLPMLTDVVSSVPRQVVTSLLPQAGSLDEHALRPLLHPRNPRHVRMAARRLLRAHGTWTRIDIDLRLVDDPAPEFRAEARADLGNWLSRDAATTYSSPSGARAAELSALISRAEPVLGAGQVRLLRFHLGLR